MNIDNEAESFGRSLRERAMEILDCISEASSTQEDVLAAWASLTNPSDLANSLIESALFTMENHGEVDLNVLFREFLELDRRRDAERGSVTRFGFRWTPGTILDYSVLADGRLVSGESLDETVAAMTRGVSVWAQHINISANYRDLRGATLSNLRTLLYPANSVAIGGVRRLHFIITDAGTSSLIARAFSPAQPPADRIIQLFDRYFQLKGHEKVSLMAHEFGHVLGFADEPHDGDRDSIMYYEPGTVPSASELSQVDIERARSFYRSERLMYVIDRS